MDNFQQLPDDAVIEVGGPGLLPTVEPKMTRVSTVQTGVNGLVTKSGYAWHIGHNCMVLKPGDQWQKGTLRIRSVIEFCPEPVADQ
jgi:hypothetical protein